MEKITIKNRAFKNMRNLKNLKSSINKLESKLEYSWDDAKDNLGKESSRFLKWLDGISEDIDKVENLGKDQAQYLKARLDALKAQVTLEKMESRNAISKRHNQINNSIQDTKVVLTRMNKKAPGQVKNLLDNINYKLESFYTRFDLFRLQLELGRRKASQDWSDSMKNNGTRVSKMKTKMENTDEHWEEYFAKMSEVREYVKNVNNW